MGITHCQLPAYIDKINVNVMCIAHCQITAQMFHSQLTLACSYNIHSIVLSQCDYVTHPHRSECF